jgi:uncharacterized membrane protein YjgN (DUF898 family)
VGNDSVTQDSSGYDGEMTFRPRFSLRTLLIVVTLAAIASWAYWIGWPWWKIQREHWQIQREQALFIESIKDLKAGMSTLEALKPLRAQVGAGSHVKTLWSEK